MAGQPGEGGPGRATAPYKGLLGAGGPTVLYLLALGLRGAGAITCFCLGHCPDNQLNGTCTAPPGGPCFSGRALAA